MGTPHKAGIASLVATTARRRLAVIAATAALFAFFTAATDVVLPLWVTTDLGYTPSQWAQLRSLRMTGVLVGVIFLGSLSDRFGQRLLGVVALVGAALVMALLGVRGREAIWVAMPVFGALVSTVFVNLNTLTQQVSDRRQGVANTVYRSVGAAAAIGAPVAATFLAHAWGGYSAVFTLFAALLLAAAIVLYYYPGEPPPPAMGTLREELRRILDPYRSALRERDLMWQIHISHLWIDATAGVGAFAAIRFTRELGQSDQQFGLLSSLAAGASFFAITASGFYLDRVSLRRLHGVAAIAASLCSVVMGLTGSVAASAVAFFLFVPITGMLYGPTSMWVSRAAGGATQSAAFAAQKVLAAIYVGVGMALLGVLEKRIGIQAILLYGGILGVVFGAAFFALKEPPAPWGKRRR